MPGDAQATKRRLLAAATAEFAAHGLAGARVDRIAAAARANKALRPFLRAPDQEHGEDHLR